MHVQMFVASPGLPKRTVHIGSCIMYMCFHWNVSRLGDLGSDSSWSNCYSDHLCDVNLPIVALCAVNLPRYVSRVIWCVVRHQAVDAMHAALWPDLERSEWSYSE